MGANRGQGAAPFFKSRHLLSNIDDPDYRRDIKGIRNVQEG